MLLKLQTQGMPTSCRIGRHRQESRMRVPRCGIGRLDSISRECHRSIAHFGPDYDPLWHPRVQGEDGRRHYNLRLPTLRSGLLLSGREAEKTFT